MINVQKISQGKQLSDAEVSVLEFLFENKNRILKLGVRGVAKENFTSTSTVMRLSKKLGYKGFVDMYYKLFGNGLMNDDIQIKNPLNHTERYEVSNKLHQSVKDCAKHITETEGLIYVYGSGFMGIMAEYLSKKFLGLGVKLIFSNGDDSIGVFENNLDSIKMLILFSRSGKSKNIVNRLQTANENSIYTVGFTNMTDSYLSQNADCAIKIEDDQSYDDRNQKPTMFYARIIEMIELLVYEYQLLNL
ncbi:MurR/RpiR family transcriptional regulator [Solobacterium moorei]|uniref:MurR/RpiR family transcriptional regulator n=1 Tax=Solobacterium moorei TaxID=102148 RepID=UPI000422EED5|nr:MurR/RpiR family transcriptional regulator [Solobacterium moorei]BET21840.1 MurR/RpiR family transcriptional regulator [Solobacterium moorei]